MNFAGIDTEADLDPYNINDGHKDTEALLKLLQFPFEKKDELGKQIGKYNGAKRIDITKVSTSRTVRSPNRFLTLIRQLAKESCTNPSYGLEIKNGNRKEYVHFLLELTQDNSVGVFFFDSKRILSVPQVHNVERLIKKTNLTGGIIVANRIGIPAKQEAARINDDHEDFGIITIEQFSSIEKRHQEVF
ncbi:MAG: hypothetical protein IH840_09290 [Candidatus Heimdallarchaeota archaeon]|nr:hypothetical protein [Candidatus Heimdallarchaeota archaeon]